MISTYMYLGGLSLFLSKSPDLNFRISLYYLIMNSHFRILNVPTKHQELPSYFNLYLTNGFSCHYHLGESTFIFWGIRSKFQFSYKFLMKILLANRIATDGTPRSAASHLWLYCLPRLIRVNQSPYFKKNSLISKMFL